MKVQWKTVLVKITIWLVAEFMLNLLGLDSLADYSEFLYKHEMAIANHLQQSAIVLPRL
jgi:preprotein translocase subunit SecG